MWVGLNIFIVTLLALTANTSAKEELLLPPATSYGVPDYRQTRSLVGNGDYSSDLVGLSTDLSGNSASDLSGFTTSYGPIASGVADDFGGVSSTANAFSTTLGDFNNFGDNFSALQSAQIPVYSTLQQVQQVPIVQQVPVLSAAQQPLIVQQPALGVEGRSLGGAGLGLLGGGLAGAGGIGGGFGGGFKRYRTSVHIRSRGFGGGLGGFGGIGGGLGAGGLGGALGGFKGIGGGFGGGRYKARYTESGGGGFAGAGAGLIGGAGGGFLG